MAKPVEDKGEKVVTRNREAARHYQFLEQYEAGLSLKGAEVKSLRSGTASLKDSYCEFKGEELFLIGTHISVYPYSKFFAPSPERPRKLLLHRQELKRLHGKVLERGLTLIPLRIYFKNGRAKVEIALCKGKKLFDHREDIKRRDIEREMRREAKYRR